MKYIKIIIMSLIMIGMLFILSGCSSQIKAKEYELDRFVGIDNSIIMGNGSVVFYDKNTKVMYLFFRYNEAAGLTILVDSEGKPLLYEGE